MMYCVALLIILMAWVQVNSNSIGVNDSGKINARASCRCVPWYQCDDSGHIITDGGGLIDPRKAPSGKSDVTPRDTTCKNPNDVCCSLPGDDKSLPDVNANLPAGNKELPSSPGSTEISHQCGVRKSSEEPFNARILNSGRSGLTKIGEYPWQVSLLRAKDGVKFFTGAGVLIDDGHILTAAHKVIDIPTPILTVRVGAWNLSDESGPSKSQDLGVSSVIIHPNYNNVSLKNDIAVLALSSKVHYDFHVESICLPEREENHEGKQCVVTGWGKNAFEDGKHSQVLKQVPVPIVNFDVCQTTLRRTRLGEFFQLDRSFICAGGEQGYDACGGDGGGPLVCLRKDGTYGLMGLVAWGIACGQPGIPGVYVNIPQFIDWITSVTKRPLDSYWPSA